MKDLDFSHLASLSNPQIITGIKDESLVFNCNYVSRSRLLRFFYYSLIYWFFLWGSYYFEGVGNLFEYSNLTAFSFFFLIYALFTLFSYLSNIYKISFGKDIIIIASSFGAKNILSVSKRPEIYFHRKPKESRRDPEYKRWVLIFSQGEFYIELPSCSLDPNSIDKLFGNFDLTYSYEEAVEKTDTIGTVDTEVEYDDSRKFKGKTFEVRGVKERGSKLIIYRSLGIVHFMTLLFVFSIIVDLFILYKFITGDEYIMVIFNAMLLIQIAMITFIICYRNASMLKVEYSEHSFKINKHLYDLDRGEVYLYVEGPEMLYGSYCFKIRIIHGNRTSLAATIPSNRVDCIESLLSGLRYIIQVN